MMRTGSARLMLAMDQRIPAPGLWRFVDDDHPAQLTLIVETPNGPYLRRISPALPLPPGVVPGTGVELAIHQAAATWGMPDFVFEPAYAVKGSGQREQGDRLLLSGGRGAVLQSKRRTVPPKDDAIERSWLQKNAAKALGQARGTVRQLRMQSANCRSAFGMSRSGAATWELPAFSFAGHSISVSRSCPVTHGVTERHSLASLSVLLGQPRDGWGRDQFPRGAYMITAMPARQTRAPMTS